MEISEPVARYKQVAAQLAQQIGRGDYAPGEALPSESALMKKHGLSRVTIRRAIEDLRAQGLIEVVHGRGSFVRGLPADVLTIEMTITRGASGDYSTDRAGWECAETPAVYRTQATADTAHLLNLGEGEALFGVDRLWRDPETGTRLAHRTLIPFATADGTELEQRPDAEPERVYAVLEAAGHTLTWREFARARMPLPDERSALQMPEATPVLHTVRVTYGRDQRPLLLEDLRTRGDRAQVAYWISADRPRHLRPARDS